MAGAFWLAIIVTAAFAEFFVRGNIVVGGDPAATAANILARERLYRLGAAAVIIYLVCDIAVALLCYELLKPVSRSLSLLASVLRLAMVAILGANLLNLFAPLVLLKGAPWLTAFKPDQLQALALAFLKLYEQVFFIALLFFGLHCLLVGYLVHRSMFLPRILGTLIAATGFCYLAHSFATVLSPALAARLFKYLMPVGFPGELSLSVWLLVVGVDVRQWSDRADVRTG
jgi:hypothetical protein